MLVVVGGPAATSLPDRSPLPASGRHWSKASMAPSDLGKPLEVVSLATQPIVGTVRIDWTW